MVRDPTSLRLKQSESTLLNLPEEVLDIIIANVTADEDLAKLVLVCRRLNALADPYRYNSINVVRGKQAHWLASSLQNRPSRAKFLRSLLVSTAFGDDVGLQQLPPQLFWMSNLEELSLETPDCNQKPSVEREPWISLQERYERLFEQSSIVVPEDQRALPRLKSCTIHFVDDRKEIYLLSKYAMLFLHPKLRELTISCASTDFPQNLLPSFQGDTALEKSTNLEYLHLEECDVHGPSLAILLSFAKCLKRLKLSEGVRYSPERGYHPRLHGDIQADDLVEALARHCQESLEWLSLALGRVSSRFRRLDLSSFTNITYLEVDLNTIFQFIPVRNCRHQLSRYVPPNLRTLKVFSIVPLLVNNVPIFHDMGRDFWPLEDCVIRDKHAHGLHNLKRLIYSFMTKWYENEGEDAYDDEEDDDDDDDQDDDDEDDDHEDDLINLDDVAPPPAVPTSATTTADDNNNNHAQSNPNNAHNLPTSSTSTATITTPTQPTPSPPTAAAAAVPPPPPPPTLLPTYTNRWRQLRDKLIRAASDQIPMFRKANVELELILVTLPSGYMPPYLFREDKPVEKRIFELVHNGVTVELGGRDKWIEAAR